MSERTRERLIEAAALAAVILVVALVIYAAFHYLFPDLLPMMLRGDEEAIEIYIRERGIWKGIITIWIVCILQVVSIVLPGWAVQIAAGLIYGWWRATLICLVGFALGQIFVFNGARLLRNRLTGDIIKLRSVQALSDRMDTYSPAVVVALAYMVPGVPNGSVPYVASRTRLTSLEFLLTALSTVWVQVLCSCAAGHFMIRGQFGYVVFYCALQLALLYIAAKNRELLRVFFERQSRRLAMLREKIKRPGKNREV